MLYEMVIVICLVIATLNLILNLRSIKVTGKLFSVPPVTPRVSVLIPARNEEINIGSCLRSLQLQHYADYEVLVLNDSSTDKTAEIVRNYAAEDRQIRLIEGETLAPGWNGKAYACHQLARQASGSWLLFVDADTVHEPNMLSSVIAMALQNNASLLSGFPRQIATSLTQKVTIPVFNFIIMSWLPLWWLQRDNKPRPSFANGQFLLFNKDEYWRVGGHKSVKSRIMEDVWLGAQVYHKRGRVLAVDLSPVVACHMYRDFGQMWHGFAKSIYALTRVPFFLIPAGILAYILFLGPFYAVFSQYVLKDPPAAWAFLVIFQIVVILFMRLLVNQHFKESVFSSLLHPLGFGFFLANAFYVLIRRITGTGVTWKKRFYGPDSGVG
ncbi:MAG TPA: glycosyltransferase family 2 protein [Dehalococcoidia bacterium]|nr:glycosyltransferase family 2 protein [Dehalococcoidia bacterium]